MDAIQFEAVEVEREGWRPVVGWEGIYSVSDLGRVRREKPAVHTEPGRLLQATSNGRYLHVSLKGHGRRNGTTMLVHKLVARAFLGPRPEGYEVNHIDGCRENNRLTNLEYVTHRENVLHAFRLGLRYGRPHKPGEMKVGDEHWARRHPEWVRRGEQAPKAKLTPDQVREIRLAPGLPRQIAERFGVARSTVARIQRLEIWKHLA